MSYETLVVRADEMLFKHLLVDDLPFRQILFFDSEGDLDITSEIQSLRVDATNWDYSSSLRVSGADFSLKQELRPYATAITEDAIVLDMVNVSVIRYGTVQVKIDDLPFR